MTALLERVPVDQITEQARQVSFSRTLLTVIAAALFGLGWLVAKAFGVLWLAVAWSATAVKVGWQEGRNAKPRGPSPVG